MTFWFGLPHSPDLVALSLVMAAFGGYVGLGLAGQAGLAAGLQRRVLLAGAAWSLGLGIWTMHFAAMLAAQLPGGTQFSVLLTLLSFLLCVLVVGVAAFLASIGSSNKILVPFASLIMGAGIVSMHYLGMHAISGAYMLHHDMGYVLAAAVIAVAASYGALRIFETRIRHQTLAVSSLIFGVAVSGMHYMAMSGTRVMEDTRPAATLGPSVSSEVLMIVVAFLAFVVSGGFLLYLIPERSRPANKTHNAVAPTDPEHKLQHQPATLVPVESEGATRLISAPRHFCHTSDDALHARLRWTAGAFLALVDHRGGKPAGQ